MNSIRYKTSPQNTLSLRIAGCLSGLLLACPAFCGVALLDDAYVSNTAVSKNFGNAATLKIVGDASDGYLRFDLASALPPGDPQVAKATLKVFVSGKKGTTGSLDVYETTTDLEELQLNRATLLVGNLIASETPVKNNWVEFDVSDYVVANQNAASLAFAIKGSTGLNADIDSKESKTTSHAASLEIEWANVSGLAGPANTAYGRNALALNTSGIYNTGIGLNALAANTGGNRNTATGDGALEANLNGLDNTATGFEALNANTTGFSNSSLGVSALAANTTGSLNTATGYNALNKNTTGAANTADGAQALLQNTTGNYNTSVGVQSLFYNTNGEANTAHGWQALYRNTTGIGNTASGGASLQANTTGNYNTAHGWRSLFANTTGTNNTASGISALQNNLTGANNTAAGYNALANNTQGSNNSALGISALSLNTTGSHNTAVGVSADVTTGNLSNTTAIGYEAKVDSSNMIRLGNADVTVIEGQVAFTTSSDQRFKTQIKDLALGADFIARLRPVEYIRINDQNKTKEWGLIAQDLQQTLKETGYQDAGLLQKDNTAEQYLSLRYNDLMAPMIKTLQDQQKTIEALTKRIEVLEQQNKAHQ